MGEFAIKVSPFGGEYGGEAMGGEGCGLAEGGDAPILVGCLTYIGCHRDLYCFAGKAI